MPELPEVETVRIQLRRKITGKTIAKVKVFHNTTVNHDRTFARRLTGKVISDIDRIGKLLIFSFEGETNLFLLAHLKMTGQFFFVDKTGDVTGGGHTSEIEAQIKWPHKHTRTAFYFTDDSVLYFNDMRLFGYTKLTNRVGLAKARAGFGPELIDPEFDCQWFGKSLRQKKTPVKAALLNQSFVAGLGNIYVDEALWRAKIRPTRRADRVSKAEAAALCAAASAVMLEAIEVGGTTFQHFKDTGGETGNFTDYLDVFGRQGQLCRRCGTMIKKIRCAGRGTHFCPGCQK